MQDLTGRTAFVTGAASGIGFGIATALSEGLRTALAPRKIGVSVLCPGVVCTQIVNSSRNVPPRLAGKIGSLPLTEGPVAEAIKAFQHRTNNGIDPLYVGELVREAIEMTGPTSSPTPSTSPSSKDASPQSGRASTASAIERRGISVATCARPLTVKPALRGV